MDAATAVAQLIGRTGLTKAELSRRSGVSRALLDDYLKGCTQPSVAQLERLGEAAGLKLDLNWIPAAVDIKPTPHWARPNPAMDPPPLTIQERAKVLELVVPVAMAQRRRSRGALEFPPFRELTAG